MVTWAVLCAGQARGGLAIVRPHRAAGRRVAQLHHARRCRRRRPARRREHRSRRRCSRWRRGPRRRSRVRAAARRRSAPAAVPAVDLPTVGPPSRRGRSGSRAGRARGGERAGRCAQHARRRRRAERCGPGAAAQPSAGPPAPRPGRPPGSRPRPGRTDAGRSRRRSPSGTATTGPSASAGASAARQRSAQSLLVRAAAGRERADDLLGRQAQPARRLGERARGVVGQLGQPPEARARRRRSRSARRSAARLPTAATDRRSATVLFGVFTALNTYRARTAADTVRAVIVAVPIRRGAPTGARRTGCP